MGIYIFYYAASCEAFSDLGLGFFRGKGGGELQFFVIIKYFGEGVGWMFFIGLKFFQWGVEVFLMEWNFFKEG